MAKSLADLTAEYALVSARKGLKRNSVKIKAADARDVIMMRVPDLTSHALAERAGETRRMVS
jgi:hypothetical protein